MDLVDHDQFQNLSSCARVHGESCFFLGGKPLKSMLALRSLVADREADTVSINALSWWLLVKPV